MRSDALLSFVPIGGNLSLVAGAGVDIPSSNTIDLLGNGVGVAPSSIIGTATLFGTDMGIGGFRPEINAVIGTALTAVAGSTLNAKLQAAADLGAAGNYQPDTWNTLAETGPMTAANLAANTVFMRFPWLPVFPQTLRPRFLRLLFSPSAGGSFTAGTVACALVTLVRDDQANKQAAKNFSVS
jgi:hypothetical protein